MKPLLAVLALAAACESAAPASSGTTPDLAVQEAAIRAQSQAFDSTLSRADTTAFTALLGDSVMWMVPEQPSLVGKAAVLARLRARFAVSRLDLHTTIEEVRVAGDWAWVRVSYHMMIAPKAGGPSINEIGKGMNTFSKGPTGSWLVTRHLWNTDNAER